MKPTVPFILAVIFMLIGSQFSCQYSGKNKIGVKHFYPIGNDTIVLYLDSTFHEIVCSNFIFDDAICLGFESNDCNISINISELPKSLVDSLNLAQRINIDAKVSSKMIEENRLCEPECTFDTPKSIKSKSGYRGVSIIFQNLGKYHLRFRGFGLRQKLLLNIDIESKSAKVDLEKIQFACLENLYFLKP